MISARTGSGRTAQYTSCACSSQIIAPLLQIKKS